MKFKPLLVARIALVLSLIIGVGSFWQIKELTYSLNSAKSSLATADQRLSTAKSNSASLTTELTPDATSWPVEISVTRLISRIMDSRLPYGVTIAKLGTASSSKLQAQPLASMATSIKGSKLKFIRLSLKGSYSTYAEFKQFLAIFNDLPAAVSFIKITDTSFELIVDSYGI